MCCISPLEIRCTSRQTCRRQRITRYLLFLIIMSIFASLFRKRKPSTRASTQHAFASQDPNAPPQVTNLKTLVIVYDPVVDTRSGKRLSESMRWNRVEDLAKGFMTDILQTSGGLARY